MGYSRVELRAEPLYLYKDSKKQSLQEYFSVIEKAVEKTKQSNSSFSVGLVAMGNKKRTKEENTNFLDEICKTNSPLIVGFDFEQ